MNIHAVALSSALVIALVNATYVGVRGQALKSKYPDAELPPATSMMWGTLIVGVISLYSLSGLARDGSPVGAVVATTTLGWISLLIDSRTHRLPSEITNIIALEVLVCWGLSVISLGPAASAFMNPALGALIWLLPTLVGVLLSQVGRGDLRLAPVLGFALGTLGLSTAVLGLVLAYVPAALFALVVRFRAGKDGRRFALGPFLLIGTWTAAVVQAAIPMVATLTQS